jgi:hypothetical protein
LTLTLILILKYGGHKADDYEGHPAPAGPALPNLINAVSMFKVKVKIQTATVGATLAVVLCFSMLSNIVPPSTIAGDREGRPYIPNRLTLTLTLKY